LNKPFYIVLFILSSTFCVAQANLVYNGDFELYDTCPVFPSSPGNYQIETCLGWKAPTYATSDYFNICAPVTTSVGVPINGFGYQLPYSGNAYCGGFVQYYAQSPNPVENGWWVEYVQSRLIFPLKAGYEYEFACKIVLSTNDWDYAFWRFGANFSQSPISRSDAKPFTGIIPQVINTLNNFITDTLNWTEIKGKFIAQGGEEYITLGFYVDTLAPDTLKLINDFSTDPTNYGAYYYIDGCSLGETGNVSEYSNAFSPNGDGINDEWNPTLLETETIEIFNRWGIKVFELSKKRQTWDGRMMFGEECTDGVYYFVVNDRDENKSKIKKGFIQLVR
jgi:gliding motility-associated-like protein